MIELSVTCPGCGSALHRTIDEDCPPSNLRCRCGSGVSLTVDEEPMMFLGDDKGNGATADMGFGEMSGFRTVRA